MQQRKLANIDAPVSEMFDQNKFISSVLTFIDHKVDEIIKTNIDLHSFTILQSEDSKASQDLNAVNKDLTNSIQIVHNNINAVSQTQTALENMQ